MILKACLVTRKKLRRSLSPEYEKETGGTSGAGPVSPRVDAQRQRVRVSVGELSTGGGRSIGLGGRGLSRLWMGQELHRKIQEEFQELEPGFAPEVPIRAELESDRWILEISGRADGVLYSGDRPVRVDEIKTLHFAVDLRGLYVEERLEPFRRQLSIYAWMLARNFGVLPEARLILIDIVSGERRAEFPPWRPEAVEVDLRKFLFRIRSEHERRERERQRLRDVAQGIAFPHPRRRPIQKDIGDEVRFALDEQRPLLLQAPTGTGKTAAVVHPAVQWAFERGYRLFFLTAKTLQQKLVVKTLNGMQEGGAFRSIQLRAKSKMCAHEEMICHEEYCPWAREYRLKMLRSGLVRRLQEGASHADPDVIYEQSFNLEVCPFEVSLDLVEDSDVVVCDYNYVFDPVIGVDALLEEGSLKETVLVVDEAHNLIQRSREYYSPALFRQDAQRALEALNRRENKLYLRLRELTGEVVSLISETVLGPLGKTKLGEERTVFDPGVFSALRLEFDAALLEYFLFKKEEGLWTAQDPIVELFMGLIRFQRVLSLGGEEFVHLARRSREEGESIRIFCRDASRFCGDIFSECAGAVAMSATLQPFEFYRDLLGIHNAREMSFASPFPRENRLIVNIPDVDTSWKRRRESYDAVAGWISRLAPRHGNTLVLFPSYAYLNDVAERLPAQLQDGQSRHLQIIRQEPGLPDQSQGEILKVLRKGEAQLVLAVLGGVFAEGIDYPGEMLSEVIIVSPALPQFNREQELLREFLEERYGHGFSYAYLIPGMTRVIQAAGRLIRSEEDRGVIILIGRRFQHSRHARFLPDDWIDGDPLNILEEDPVFVVNRFFEN